MTQLIFNTGKNFLLILCVFLCFPALAATEIRLEIKNHKFEPSIIKAKQGTVVRIQIVNMDTVAEEFESIDLNREKIVPANGSVFIRVGPLKPGKYKFFGEFHPASAKGELWVE